MNSSILKRHFEIYGEEKDKFSDDWALNYFERSGVEDDMNLEYRNETDSGNFSCGDEAELIYSQMIDDLKIYWIQTSSGGASGPFLKANEAIEALGYSPRVLKRRKGWRENR